MTVCFDKLYSLVKWTFLIFFFSPRCVFSDVPAVVTRLGMKLCFFSTFLDFTTISLVSPLIKKKLAFSPCFVPTVFSFSIDALSSFFLLSSPVRGLHFLTLFAYDSSLFYGCRKFKWKESVLTTHLKNAVWYIGRVCIKYFCGGKTQIGPPDADFTLISLHDSLATSGLFWIAAALWSMFRIWQLPRDIHLPVRPAFYSYYH